MSARRQRLTLPERVQVRTAVGTRGLSDDVALFRHRIVTGVLRFLLLRDRMGYSISSGELVTQPPAYNPESVTSGSREWVW